MVTIFSPTILTSSANMNVQNFTDDDPESGSETGDSEDKAKFATVTLYTDH
jgi:hypothetical protein